MKKTGLPKQIIKELLEKAKTLPIGTSITAWQLFTATYPGENPDSFDMIRLAIELKEHDKDAGLYFDSSHHWGLVEGLPYNLDFIIKQRKPAVQFDQINYIESAFPGPDQNLIIDLQGKSICYFEEPSPTEPVQYKCTKTQWERIEDIIKSCDFAQWEREYNNMHILDGMQWEIKLIRNGETCRKFYGSNKYPSSWRIFWALKQMCSRLIKRESVSMYKPKKCPFCGSAAVKPYLYGMPTAEAAYSGKYIIGGCCIEEGQPKWGCEDCGAKFIEGDPHFDNYWQDFEDE